MHDKLQFQKVDSDTEQLNRKKNGSQVYGMIVFYNNINSLYS